MRKINLRFGVITGMILLAALSRLIPYPANFVPVGGMALFGATCYSKRCWAILIPIVSMWISDLILNNARCAGIISAIVCGPASYIREHFSERLSPV